MTQRPRQTAQPRRLREDPTIPAWFKIWVAFCTALGLVVVVVVIWALVTLVQHVAR